MIFISDFHPGIVLCFCRISIFGLRTGDANGALGSADKTFIVAERREGRTWPIGPEGTFSRMILRARLLNLDNKNGRLTRRRDNPTRERIR
jgi:hypothetical protein